MDDATIRGGLDYAAASIEAIELTLRVTRAVLAALVREINVLRALAIPPLLPLTLADLVPDRFEDFIQKRGEILDRIRGQRPNELRPWEAA